MQSNDLNIQCPASTYDDATLSHFSDEASETSDYNDDSDSYDSSDIDPRGSYSRVSDSPSRATPYTGPRSPLSASRSRFNFGELTAPSRSNLPLQQMNVSGSQMNVSDEQTSELLNGWKQLRNEIITISPSAKVVAFMLGFFAALPNYFQSGEFIEELVKHTGLKINIEAAEGSIAVLSTILNLAINYCAFISAWHLFNQLRATNRGTSGLVIREVKSLALSVLASFSSLAINIHVSQQIMHEHPGVPSYVRDTCVALATFGNACLMWSSYMQVRAALFRSDTQVTANRHRHAVIQLLSTKLPDHIKRRLTDDNINALSRGRDLVKPLGVIDYTLIAASSAGATVYTYAFCRASYNAASDLFKTDSLWLLGLAIPAATRLLLLSYFSAKEVLNLYNYWHNSPILDESKNSALWFVLLRNFMFAVVTLLTMASSADIINVYIPVSVLFSLCFAFTATFPINFMGARVFLDELLLPFAIKTGTMISTCYQRINGDDVESATQVDEPIQLQALRVVREVSHLGPYEAEHYIFEAQSGPLSSTALNDENSHSTRRSPNRERDGLLGSVDESSYGSVIDLDEHEQPSRFGLSRGCTVM